MPHNALPALFNADTALAPQIRDQIVALEAAMAAVPGAVFGDSEENPLIHRWADGIYVREIFIPKGTLIVGKLHRHRHPNVLLKGEVIVVTEGGGREHLVAPLAMISEAGTKRVVYALEDTTWVTFHHNPHELRDIAALEEQIIAPSYAALDAGRAEAEENES
jgi:hypothetical protein